MTTVAEAVAALLKMPQDATLVCEQESDGSACYAGIPYIATGGEVVMTSAGWALSAEEMEEL